jgi:hypothetical protein
MEPVRHERSGMYRPGVPSRIPRCVPDEEFNEIFARLPSHRERALVAFCVHRGACVGAFVGDPWRGGSGTAADHRGAEGNPDPLDLVPLEQVQLPHDERGRDRDQQQGGIGVSTASRPRQASR